MVLHLLPNGLFLLNLEAFRYLKTQANQMTQGSSDSLFRSTLIVSVSFLAFDCSGLDVAGNPLLHPFSCLIPCHAFCFIYDRPRYTDSATGIRSESYL